MESVESVSPLGPLEGPWRVRVRSLDPVGSVESVGSMGPFGLDDLGWPYHRDTRPCLLCRDGLAIRVP